MIPLLLPYDNPVARDIASLVGIWSPAKEVVMAVQEAAERLEHSLEEEEGGEPDEKEGYKPKLKSPVEQFLILIDLYVSGESCYIALRASSFRG